MGDHCHANLWIQFKSLLQSHRIHIPGIVFGVNEHRDSALIHHRVYGGRKGHIRAEHLLSGLYPGQLHGQVEGRGAGGQGHGILTPHGLTGQALHLVDILSDGGHPVLFIGVLYIFQLQPVHGGRAEPDLFFKWHEPFFCAEHVIIPLVFNRKTSCFHRMFSSG